jgi:RND family efflux transporter MFP subunit
MKIMKEITKPLPNFIALIALILFISCTKPNSQEETTTASQATPNISQVAVVEAKMQPFALELLSNGRVLAQGRASLQFKMSGIIERIVVSNGQSVSAGALLAVLDNSAQQVAVEQAQVQLKEARLELNKLLIEYGGEDNDSSSVRPRIWEAVKTKSGYFRAQANLHSARLILDNTYLRAPYSGVVANLKTKAHNPTTMSEPFCLLLSRAAVLVEFSVLESELSVVQVGQEARVLPVALEGRSYAAVVSEVNPFVNEQGLVLVKARIQNPDKQLFEGMNARVIIEKQLGSQLVVPKEAVVERSGRKVVFCYEAESDTLGLAKWHYVTVLHENQQQLAIGEGLKAGEKVIVEGNMNLGHDARVRLKNK